jgi:heme a synthase
LGADQRPEWVHESGLLILVHRSFSIVILFTNLAAVWLIRQMDAVPNPIRWAAYGVLACITGEIVAGAILFYAAMPAVLQPVHLVLAAAMAGLQWYLWIALRNRAEEPSGETVAVI